MLLVINLDGAVLRGFVSPVECVLEVAGRGEMS